MAIAKKTNSYFLLPYTTVFMFQIFPLLCMFLSSFVQLDNPLMSFPTDAV